MACKHLIVMMMGGTGWWCSWKSEEERRKIQRAPEEAKIYKEEKEEENEVSVRLWVVVVVVGTLERTIKITSQICKSFRRFAHYFLWSRKRMPLLAQWWWFGLSVLVPVAAAAMVFRKEIVCDAEPERGINRERERGGDWVGYSYRETCPCVECTRVKYLARVTIHCVPIPKNRALTRHGWRTGVLLASCYR